MFNVCELCRVALLSAGAPQTPDESHKQEIVCATCLGLLAPYSGKQFGSAFSEVYSKYDAVDKANVTITPSSSHIFRWCCLAISRGVSALSAETTLRELVKEHYIGMVEKLLPNVPVRVGKLDDGGVSGCLQVYVEFYVESSVMDIDAAAMQCFGKRVDRDAPPSSSEIMSMLHAATMDHVHAATKLLSERALASGALPRVTVKRSPLHIAARYWKYSRSLAHTPWSGDDTDMPTSSAGRSDSLGGALCGLVQSTLLAADKQIHVNRSTITFTSGCAGREDRDVRMLGSGRPFVFRILDAKRVPANSGDLIDMEARLNGLSSDFTVSDLRLVGNEALQSLKNGEQEKTKVYVALCHSPNAKVTASQLHCLTQACPLVLSQETPVRVLQRRSVTSRQRTVLHMRPMLLDTNNFLLSLSTQAGTYVKEFVCGDFGRTKPSLAELLWPENSHDKVIDILQLDVTEIKMDWPSK